MQPINHSNYSWAVLRVTIILIWPQSTRGTTRCKSEQFKVRSRRETIPALVLHPIAATGSVAIDVVDAGVVEVKRVCIKVASGLVRAAKATFKFTTTIVDVGLRVVVACALDVAAFHDAQVAIFIHVNALPDFGEVAGKRVDAGGLGLAGNGHQHQKKCGELFHDIVGFEVILGWFSRFQSAISHSFPQSWKKSSRSLMSTTPLPVKSPGQGSG